MIDKAYVYEPGFIDDAARVEIVSWLATLRPLWEQRYSTRRPLPPGKQQRGLLRPVYWLGNWQFACLGYYEPPQRTVDVAVAAEPFPPVLARLVAVIERRVRARFSSRRSCRAAGTSTPASSTSTGTGSRAAKTIDAARVGEHRDFEPGPGRVAVARRARAVPVRARAAPAMRRRCARSGSRIGSLQIFGGPRWKDDLLHRVQRVDDKHDARSPARDRRVPDAARELHVPLRARRARRSRSRGCPERARDDVRGYVPTLAASSPFFKAALASEPRSRTAATR